MNDMEKEEDVFFAIYQRDRRLLEEKRADIIKRQQKIDAEQGILDDGRRQIRQWLSKEVIMHCNKEGFLLAMEDSEDEIHDSYRKVESVLMDEKDKLKDEKRKTYEVEEELETEYKKNNLEKYRRS